MPIHYSEGLFPLNLYTNNYKLSYTNGYHLDNICNCSCCNTDIHKEITKAELANPFLTGIYVEAETLLRLRIEFSNGGTKTFELKRGDKYKIQYIENGSVKTVVGVITKIGKVGSVSGICTCNCCSEENPDYILLVDSSVDYTSHVVSIRTSNIRNIDPYIPFADEDTTIENSRLYGVVVIGDLTDIILSEATIDKNGNLFEGKLVSGTIGKDKCIIADGCATGTNPLGHTITTIDGMSVGGTAASGTVISGALESFTISGGETDEETGKTSNCIIHAGSGVLVVTDVTVLGAKTTGGTVIIPKLENSTVTGGIRSGADMITKGALVVGDIAYGGIVKGGTLNGGVATGIIGDKSYMIINGITTEGATTNASIEKGVVSGGKHVDNTVICATITGGIATAGNTVNGITVLGGNESYIKPVATSLPEEIVCKCPKVYDGYVKKIYDVIVWWKTNTLNSQVHLD